MTTFAAAISGNDTHAGVGDGAVIRAAKSATVKAESEEILINMLASASGAVNKASAAGVIGVLVSQSNT